MLQNAVNGMPHLHAVKMQADQLASQTDNPLSHVQYLALLQSAATQYDKELLNHKHAGTASCGKRTVYVHDVGSLPDVGYDIDTPVETYQGNIHESEKVTGNVHDWSTSFLSCDQYSKLTDDEKQVWDTFTDKTKLIILGQDDDRNSPSHTPKWGVFKSKGHHPNLLYMLKNAVNGMSHLHADKTQAGQLASNTTLLHEQQLGSEGDVDDSSTFSSTGGVSSTAIVDNTINDVKDMSNRDSESKISLVQKEGILQALRAFTECMNVKLKKLKQYQAVYEAKNCNVLSVTTGDNLHIPITGETSYLPLVAAEQGNIMSSDSPYNYITMLLPCMLLEWAVKEMFI